MDEKVGFTFLAVRLVSVIVVHTWFVPDEFYQATELAHRWVFGYGYVTWEWKEGIRSILYPGVFAILYKILQVLHLDYVFLLIHTPRILSAVWFSLGDYSIWKVTKQLYGSDSAAWAAVCLSSCWFLSYSAPRTLTSSAEMVFVALALRNYPWRVEKESASTNYLLWTGIGCAIRPTTVVPIIPLSIYHIYCCRRKALLLLKYFFIICIVLALSVGLDSWYYDKLTIVPLNFIKINALDGISKHYGTHVWHWYFTLGLPSTLGSHLIPMVIGVCCNPKRYFYLLIPCVFSIIVHSFLSHKEFRFLLPILPLLLCISGDFISEHLKNCVKKTDIPPSTRSVIFLIMLIVPSVLALIYLGLLHQRGPLDTIAALTPLIATTAKPYVLFLTPCHSTPLYSHIHINISTRFLTCEPNLAGLPHYMDEADKFYSNPGHWLHSTFLQKDASHLVKGPRKMGQYYMEESPLGYEQNEQILGNKNSRYETLKRPYPSHIVMFDNIEATAKQFLDVVNYKLCKKVFNAHFQDGKKGKYFHIYCKE